IMELDRHVREYLDSNRFVKWRLQDLKQHVSESESNYSDEEISRVAC
ncbi:17726_t:CDS:1, partial [Racocetra persica]